MSLIYLADYNAQIVAQEGKRHKPATVFKLAGVTGISL
jgi:hypothetical protein